MNSAGQKHARIDGSEKPPASARQPLTGFDLIHAAYEVEGLDVNERAVLVRLAVMANEDGAWPSVEHLVQKTGASERTVQRAITRLIAAGHITQRRRRHQTALYLIHPRPVTMTPVSLTPVTVTGLDENSAENGTFDEDFKPVTVTPVRVTPVTQTARPVTVTPKQPIITNTSGDKSPSVARERNADVQTKGTRLPEGWNPGPLPASVAALVGQWPPGREQRELEQFRDYWTSRTRDAARLNWDKTWHNRIRDQHDRIMRDNRHGQLTRPGGAQPSGNGIGRGTRAAINAMARLERDGSPPRESS
ncbi:MAG TPA: helix-turn-helix domain-containing protein [Sphingobium sp.]|uniref:helix-turn-helix domain-containing protein n=1 Tax=Sphingobium sp. TaxID=1912891 RepID=UPI002ED3E11F